MPIKPLDFAIMIPALAIVAASFIFAYAGAAYQSGISIKAEGGEWMYPTDTTETITVSGPLGDTVIGIDNSRARVLSSPCSNQICVTSGAIASHGQ